MDRVRIEGLEVRCIVGVYPHERDVLQRLVVDVDLGLHTETAAMHERMSETVDYFVCAQQITFLLERCRFRMLETAAHALARYFLAPPAFGEKRAQIQTARITLMKPEALRNRARCSVTIEREASSYAYAVEPKPWGTVDVIHETEDAGIYRLNVRPGGMIPLHVHRVMEESEMVLSPGLLCQGRPVAVGTVHRWPHDAPHVYENPTDRFQTILCIDSPRFLEEDEIAVDGAPAEVQPEPRWRP